MQKVPVGIKVELNEKEWFKKYKELAKNKPYHVLLESGRGGRYHIIGLDPVASLKGKGEELHIDYLNGSTQKKTGNPVHLLQEILSKRSTKRLPGFPDFTGGAIGYLSYDCVRLIENLPALADDDLGLPDLYFLLFDDVFVYDKLDKMLYLITHVEKGCEAHGNERLELYRQQWTDTSAETVYPYVGSHHTIYEREVSLTEGAFMKAVEKVQSYIAQGDVFQVNLSVRQGEPLRTHPMEIYTALRQINPSPYMGYLQFPEFQLVSGSPELLVKKKGDIVSTRPIAGTRSRGKTDKEDQELAKELIDNEKERAEHVMLVDLERNDLGRVCQYGTVEVNEFMAIEKYSHVMHIVSNVQGVLAAGKQNSDIIEATFPGGTITGAPKVRTMEIIEELEPVRRSIYTGSIGWLGYDGEMELNISIRTMVAKDGMAYVQAGAGVVIDSVPIREYKESLKKAAALWRAKELSEEEQKNRAEVSV
ncbi:anthranilate synthase component I family protein [Sutcliffiella rhizosphaerae]|uniref:Aminodeoxychorismate synthase component 1 n=1 Tax=Sutcliffiella rhizosphaerae TaxID=2880967 RepID=A0ABM8YTX2_9BACI|nr:anthranilate synthase component I family protein [Sutcliffiella rhizosphaerae]CAG9623420.1 Aminodeoxychorismate synthase component 1 [Sutcliffiella rhizosphaerae]